MGAVIFLYLMRSIDETVASTVLIIIDPCFDNHRRMLFYFSKRSGVLTGLVAITAGFIFIFINSIVIFNLIFNITPDINDFFLL
jgi:hypothetical protein